MQEKPVESASLSGAHSSVRDNRGDAFAKIKVPAELFSLAESSRFEGELFLPKLVAGPDEYAFGGPIAWVVDVTNTGSALLIAGHARATAEVACSRCLEDVSVSFDGGIEGYFLIGGSDAEPFEGREEDLGEDEFDVLPDDHVIDLEPLIIAALLVDAPEQPLCRDDCAGLCPNCGANLNEGDCGCGGDAGLADFDRESNPFSVLADFKFK